MTTKATGVWRFAAAGAALAIGMVGVVPARAGAQAAPPRAAPGGGGVVHSWALSPGDGTTGGRSQLTYEVAPGAEVTDAVTLFNYSNVSLRFDVYATDARNTPDGAFEPLPGGEEPKDVGTWVTLPQTSIIVDAHGRATFPITLRVPVDARPGDHAGAVLAASKARGTGPKGDAVTVDRRTGTRLYVRVAGPLEPELAVEGLSTSYTPGLDPTSGRAEVRYRVANRGNVRLTGSHRLSVAGPFGAFRRRLGASDLPELLPGESIEVRRTLDDVAGTVLAFAKVDLEPQAVEGAGVEGLEPVSRRSFGLALPVTVFAIVLVGLFAWCARRSYVRRREEGGGGGTGVGRGPSGGRSDGEGGDLPEDELGSGAGRAPAPDALSGRPRG